MSMNQFLSVHASRRFEVHEYFSIVVVSCDQHCQGPAEGFQYDAKSDLVGSKQS